MVCCGGREWFESHGGRMCERIGSKKDVFGVEESRGSVDVVGAQEEEEKERKGRKSPGVLACMLCVLVHGE